MIDTKHENAIKVKEWFGKSYLERSLITNKGETMTKQKTISVYAPTYRKAGVDHKGNAQFDVSMKVIGQATSYADAKAKFGVLAIVDGYAREVDEE